MTCIGNSGPLHENVANVIEKNGLVCCGVLSGNRNFEGRIHPLTRANYLASPLLVIAYALGKKFTTQLLVVVSPYPHNDKKTSTNSFQLELLILISRFNRLERVKMEKKFIFAISGLLVMKFRVLKLNSSFQQCSEMFTKRSSKVRRTGKSCRRRVEKYSLGTHHQHTSNIHHSLKA